MGIGRAVGLRQLFVRFLYVLLPGLGVVLATIPAANSGAQATYTVTSTADPGDGVSDGTCTLREAITAANGGAGLDTIAFDLPGTPPYKIQPSTPLPTITDPLVIDGATEPDFVTTPVVEPDGGLLLYQNGLHITAGNSTVRGVVVNRFQGASGILLETNGSNLIEGNRIGTNIAGTIGLGNGEGIRLLNSPGNAIGGTFPARRNIISGNGWEAIDVQLGSNGTTIQGNYIGLDATGSYAIANAGDAAVAISCASNTAVGGTAPGAGNVISGNLVGISTNCHPQGGQTIRGNLIGTDATGSTAVPNTTGGINLSVSFGTVVGGTTASARNIVLGKRWLWNQALEHRFAGHPGELHWYGPIGKRRSRQRRERH